MNYFLAKTDPETYSLDDFARERQTVWDGVRNAQAVRAIRAMRPGDRVLIYHSGGESAILGLAEVVSDPRDDPKDPKSAVVELKFLRRLEPGTTLQQIKQSQQFDDFALVRQSRLSTMEVPLKFIEWLRARLPEAKI